MLPGNKPLSATSKTSSAPPVEQASEVKIATPNPEVKMETVPQPAISKPKREFINKVENSKIKSIRVEREAIQVFYKNGTDSYIVGNRIVHFMNKIHADMDVDSELFMRIKVELKLLFDRFDPTQPRLEQVDVDSLYKLLYNNIVAAKKSAHNRGKPLLVLFGEYHYSQYSLLCELITLEILKGMGLKTICLEVPSNIKDMDIFVHLGEIDYNCLNLILMCYFARFEQIKSRFIDDEFLRDKTSDMLEIGEAIDKQLDGIPTDQKFDEMSSLISSARDQGMSLQLSLTTFNPDEKENKVFNKDLSLRMAIVGSGHLMGITENSYIAAMYHVLPINSGFNLENTRSDNKAFTQRSTYNRNCMFFRVSSPRVLRLKDEKDCSCYTNLELYEMMLKARISFRKQQGTVLTKEIQLLDNLLQLTKDMFLTPDETNLCLNLQNSVLAIYNDRTIAADLQRIELRNLLNETCQILLAKGLEKKNLIKELLVLISKLEDVPLLNPTEYRNVKKLSTLSSGFQRQSVNSDALSRARSPAMKQVLVKSVVSAQTVKLKL